VIPGEGAVGAANCGQPVTLRDRNSEQRVFGIWPGTDPHAAVIWKAFKPESEPRRTTGRDTIDLAAAVRQAQPTAPAADRRDSDFLQRQGGIY